MAIIKRPVGGDVRENVKLAPGRASQRREEAGR